jgi:aquaporin Z
MIEGVRHVRPNIPKTHRQRVILPLPCVSHILASIELLTNRANIRQPASRLVPREGRAMRKYAAELIGTFFLVLTIGCTGIAAGAGVIPPIAIGSVLMVMIYAGGHISGGHYNPAVTLGVSLRGRLAGGDVLPYITAQVLGGLLAAGLVLFFKSGESVAPFMARIGAGFAAEFLYTFALVYVVLNTATARETANNSYFGLAIGFTVLAGAFAVGNVSGAAFNPAVAVGAMAMGMLSWGRLWLYLVAELLGGAAAAIVFIALHPEDR